jgi:GrpB-like predicted nucleotidyltransferase (UPF0157 family)
MRVCVVAPDPTWKHQFDVEAACIADALGGLVVAIHHIGSTAIPGIFAKPIIDILLEVHDIQVLDARTSAVEILGYEAMGEFGIARRRYFRRNGASGIRTHQIHSFQANDVEIERHLAFRDYLAEHSEAALAYSDLKRVLAAQHPNDINAYMDGKDPFIKEYEAKAVVWWRSKLTA